MGEEHIWLGTLSKSNSVLKFEGCDDESRHVIEIISLDHEDKRISGTLCSLSLKNSCSVSLDSLTISPPTAFKLLKGDGPLTISGNLMKEPDLSLLDESEEDLLNGAENEEELEDEEEAAKIEEMETSSEEESEKENKKPAQKRKKHRRK